MKKIIKSLFILLFIGIAIYFNVSCDADKTVTTLGTLDLGILQTDEIGNIIGGDYTDWCRNSPADTFTYVVSFTLTSLNNSKIAYLKWTTSKEYHNYGFFIGRIKSYQSHDTTYLKFIQGQGIKYDSTYYSYSDTVNRVSDYTYILKMVDIYGNYKYFIVGQTSNSSIMYPFFGPAYPNPTTGKFTIPFAIAKRDSISIFLISNNDTIYLTKNKLYQQGTYKITYSFDTTLYHDVQVRLYFRNNSLYATDSCKNYGDIQFN
jgi:hypothetical protein